MKTFIILSLLLSFISYFLVLYHSKYIEKEKCTIRDLITLISLGLIPILNIIIILLYLIYCYKIFNFLNKILNKRLW